MKIRKDKIVSFLMIIFLLVLGSIEKIYSLENNDVLFISSFNPNYISFDDQVRGILNGINRDVNLQIEYMDSKIIGHEDNEEDFYNLLKYNLSNYEKFEAIIVGDDEALEFAIKYRNDLFKDIPIVFLAVEDNKLIKKALSFDMVFGVGESESLKCNIKLINKFHSDVKNISIISRSEDEIDDSLKELDEKINVNINKIVTEDLSIDEFKKKLSNLDSDDAILIFYPNDFKDGYLGYQEVTNLIKKTTNNIPIYNILGYGVNNGSIGGKVISHYHQGENAGKIVNSILSGKEIEKKYIDQQEVNKFIFDYNIMKEFNIKKKDLPKDSIIINDPADFFSEYRILVFSVVLFFIGLLGIIVALVLYVRYKIKYEKMLVKAVKEANEANRLKSHFISNINHELRTPITVIMSVMQLAKSTYKGDKYTLNNDNYNLINCNCNRLLRLINNIIDVDRFECGNIDLNLENINIVEFVEGIVSSIIPYVDTKHLNIEFDTTDEEIIIAVDVNKIERIVLNLLSNSIKFSKDNGLIKVNIYKKDSILKLIVEDNGIGIEDKDLGKVFDRFVQIDNTMTRKNEGSGIGLSIVKSFIECHNGNISIESKINEGTRFIIELPIIKLDENIKSNINNIEEITERSKLEFSDIY